LTLLVSILFSGCWCEKPLPPKKCIEHKPYAFESVELGKDIYIETPTKKLQQMCTPVALQVGKICTGVNDFYIYQIEQYKKDFNGSKPKTTK
jgi:hypothetical protein